MENGHSPLPARNLSTPHHSPPSSPPSRWTVWLATGLGAGYLPVMPGTYGSAEGAVLYLGLAGILGRMPHGLWILCAAMAALTVISLWIIHRALPHFSSDDPSAIVLDEVAGQGITLLGIAFVHSNLSVSWPALAAGFLLFRALDALKPYPIWKLGHYKGAVGVLADDVGAAIGAALALYALGRFGWV